MVAKPPCSTKPVRSLNVYKKRFGTSPERHCLTAMPYRLFQGNLNPKDLKRHKIATQSFIFFFNFLIFDTNQGRQTEIYAPELVTLVVAFH